MSVKNRNSVVTDGLVFYVDAGNEDSYAGSGTTWNDMISGNVGTLYNGPTFDSANGGSIDFDGSNDRTDFPSDSSFKPTGSMTLLVWAKGESTGSIGIIGVIGPGGDRGYFIGCNNTKFRFTIASGADSLVDAEAAHTDTTSAPFMLTGVYSASTHLKLYKNTSEIASNTTSIPATQYVGTKPLQIGNRGDSLANAHWNGNVYCAMIYNKALSADEILQNYNALKNRFI